MDYIYDIMYKLRKENRVAYALSGKELEPVPHFMILLVN